MSVRQALYVTDRIFDPASGTAHKEYCTIRGCDQESHKVSYGCDLVSTHTICGRWQELAEQNPGIEDLCVDLVENQNSSAKTLLSKWRDSLQLLSIESVDVAEVLPADGLPVLRQITVNALDVKTAKNLFALSPGLRCIRCKSTEFKEWNQVPPGVEILCEGYCSLSHDFGGKALEHSLIPNLKQCKTLMICGSEKDVKHKEAAGHSGFVAYRASVKEGKHKEFHFGVIADEDINDIVTHMKDSLECLRVAFATFTDSGLMDLRKAVQLKFLIVSLRRNGQHITLKGIKKFVQLSFKDPTMQRFEIYDEFLVSDDEQKKLMQIETELKIAIFSLHHLCGTWSLITANHGDVKMDGLMFRRVDDLEHDERPILPRITSTPCLKDGANSDVPKDPTSSPLNSSAKGIPPDLTPDSPAPVPSPKTNLKDPGKHDERPSSVVKEPEKQKHQPRSPSPVDSKVQPEPGPIFDDPREPEARLYDQPPAQKKPGLGRKPEAVDHPALHPPNPKQQVPHRGKGQLVPVSDGQPESNAPPSESSESAGDDKISLPQSDSTGNSPVDSSGESSERQLPHVKAQPVQQHEKPSSTAQPENHNDEPALHGEEKKPGPGQKQKAEGHPASHRPNPKQQVPHPGKEQSVPVLEGQPEAKEPSSESSESAGDDKISLPGSESTGNSPVESNGESPAQPIPATETRPTSPPTQPDQDLPLAQNVKKEHPNASAEHPSTSSKPAEPVYEMISEPGSSAGSPPEAKDESSPMLRLPHDSKSAPEPSHPGHPAARQPDSPEGQSPFTRSRLPKEDKEPEGRGRHDPGDDRVPLRKLGRPPTGRPLPPLPSDDSDADGYLLPSDHSDSPNTVNANSPKSNKLESSPGLNKSQAAEDPPQNAPVPPPLGFDNPEPFNRSGGTASSPDSRSSSSNSPAQQNSPVQVNKNAPTTNARSHPERSKVHPQRDESGPNKQTKRDERPLKPSPVAPDHDAVTPANKSSESPSAGQKDNPPVPEAAKKPEPRARTLKDFFRLLPKCICKCSCARDQ